MSPSPHDTLSFWDDPRGNRPICGRGRKLQRLAGLQIPRYDPELLAYFEEHRRRWRAGEFQLRDFAPAPQVFEQNGRKRILWYAAPLGTRVIPDKAALFESCGYRPSEVACQFHASTAKIKVFSGGARSGKSLAAGMEMLPILLTPGTQTWIVAPEYEQGRKEFGYLEDATIKHPDEQIRKGILEQVNPKRGGRYMNNPKKGDMEIRLGWGPAPPSFVRVKSASKPISLLTEELDCICVVEASEIPAERWERRLAMRLTTREGVAIIPSSPSGMSWVADLFDRGMSREPGVFAINCDSRMNPTISAREVEFWSKDMSDEDFQEQVCGKPTPKHGLVYPSFDRNLHVDPWQSDWPKPSWRRYRAVDFGYVDPFVVLWIAEDEDRRLYVYREFYQTKQMVSDVVRYIARVEGWATVNDSTTGKSRLLGGRGRREKIALTITDWDAAGRAEFAHAGIRARRADKSLIDGIRTVAAMLKLQDDGRPRLFIHPGCRNTIREFNKYQWDSRAEVPKDTHNHSMDAVRYLAHTTQPRHRDMTIRYL